MMTNLAARFDRNEQLTKMPHERRPARAPGRAAGTANFGLGLLLLACGGRTLDDDAGGSAPNAVATGQPTSNDSRPPTAGAATCEAVCAHIIGSCVAGASTARCVQDCQGTRAIATCATERDALLNCMLTTPVQCSATVVVALGCSEQTKALERCML